MLKKIRNYNRSFLLDTFERAERFFETDMEYILKGGFWINLPQVVSAVTSLLIAIAFANFVSQETYGVYKYVLSIAGIIGAFSLTGMNTAIVRAVAQGKDSTFPDSIPVQMRWSTLTLIAALTVSGYYLYQENFILAAGVLIVAVFQPISNVTNTFTAYLNGKSDYKTLAKYTLASNFITAIALIAIITLQGNVILIIAAYFFSAALANTIFYYRTRRLLGNSSPSDPEAIEYGKRLSLLNILGNVSGQIDNILIFHYLGAMELSLFAFAMLVPDKIKTLFRFTSVLALPKFSQKSREEMRAIVKSKTLKLLIVSVVAMVIYIAIAPLIYKTLFSQYTDSIILSQVFALTFLAIPVYIPSAALYSMGSSKELYWSSILNPVVHIVITFILVYFFGLWGAVTARIISNFFNLAFSLYLTTKKTEWL
jgi:O-antigen/teichoic acid export membrane protein